MLDQLDMVLIQIGDNPITVGTALLATLILVATFIVTKSALKALGRAQVSRPNFAKSHQFVLGRIMVYTFGTIGVLMALASLGVEFRKLTLIAGALSVGIGFGLQHTIHNFISGIILISERAIRVGDWIIVDQTEGIVSKINLRATLVKTWDDADVVVPNADMILAKVTNLTLESPHGRLIFSVDVAYGSDTALVRKLLLDTAKSHPAVVTDGSAPEPLVLHLGFGDNALHMELRCFIKDIMEKYFVMSDLYFAIDEALRKNGIEIPFPQRDVHVKSWIAPGRDETGTPNAH